jgi:hypothetical protein
MRSRIRRHVPAALLCLATLAVGGCAESDLHQYLGHSDTLTVGAGNAQAANRTVHEVDHWPNASRKTRVDQDGHRAALAIKRYQRNESLEPKGLTKRDVSISIGEPGVAVKQ